MKDEARIWLDYATENLESARVLLSSQLFNPCLQNVQQCVEKALKSLLVKTSTKIIKTHSIAQLKHVLEKSGLKINMSNEECEFLDSIYLPSKYPLTSVLPDYEPNLQICNQAVEIAERVLEFCLKQIK